MRQLEFVPSHRLDQFQVLHFPMKISCEREKFSQAFQLVASAVAGRDVKPVLQNVKATATKKSVLLQATDTEVGIRLVLDDCEGLEKGNAILPTKQFKRILQESHEVRLHIESDQERTIVSGERSRFTLPTQSADEFPDVAEFDETSYHEVSVKVLREIIRRTIFAIDADNTQYSLTSVLLEFVDNKILGVATDGKRLAFQEGVAECIGEHKAEGTLFPAKALQLLEKALSGDDEVVQVSVSNNRALFRSGNITFFTRLVEGRFPRWRTIIPTTEGKSPIVLLAGTLNSAIRLAACVTSEREPGLIFTFGEGKLVLQGRGAELGEGDVEVPIAYSDEAKAVKLDPRFFTDYLKAVGSETSLSLYVDEPVHIRTDDAYIYVVMPMS